MNTWTRALLSLALCVWLPLLPGTGSDLLDDFSVTTPWRPISGWPLPVLETIRRESAPAGDDLSALRCRFFPSEKMQYIGRTLEPRRQWDQAAGLSFWFRGDGGDGAVAITLIDETFTQRYIHLLPLKNTEWRQVKLRWDQFVPETIVPRWLDDPESSLTPSKLGFVWFGRGYFLKPWDGCVFELDQVRLEERLERPGAALRPPKPGIPRTVSKLRAHQPIRILALGDSITEGHGLAKPAEEAWPAVLEGKLRTWFGYEAITVTNLGRGGLQTRQALARLPLDLAREPTPPDLVIVHLGFNDYSAMEDRRLDPDARKQIARHDFVRLVEHIREETQGNTEILLVATLPGGRKHLHKALDFFGDMAREVAAEERCGFTSGPREAFYAALARGELDAYYKRADGGVDISHPNAEGQQVFAEALLKSFTE